LSENAKQIYSGDITCPDTFKFVLESKFGYEEIDLCSLFEGKNSLLDGFLKQVEDDSERTGRKPILIWKKNRKPRIAFVKKGDLKGKYTTMLHYGNWRAIPFDELLSQPNDYWFNL
jgi:hypothetical protein